MFVWRLPLRSALALGLAPTLDGDGFALGLRLLEPWLRETRRLGVGAPNAGAHTIQAPGCAREHEVHALTRSAASWHLAGRGQPLAHKQLVQPSFLAAQLHHAQLHYAETRRGRTPHRLEPEGLRAQVKE